MSLIDAILLGILQGLTEFLPVSSSGHIELGKWLLGTELENDLLFSVLLHFATALSTLIVFRRFIAETFSGLLAFRWNDSTRFALLVLLSMIPTGVIGLLFKKQIESFFEGNLLLVGMSLLLTATLLSLTHFARNNEHTKEVTPLQALLMGIAQTIAILPGLSRSGATIATGLLAGGNREKVARFSFLMVLPPIIGASLLEIKDLIEAPEVIQQAALLPLVAGFVAAFLTGLLACQWMISIVKKGKLMYFAAYCLLVGLIACAAALSA